MPRITMEIIEAVMDNMEGLSPEAMGRTKARLLKSQPEMHLAMLMMEEQGASKDDVENLTAVLVVALMAMEQTGLPWPKITLKMMTKGFMRLLGLVEEGWKLPRGESSAFHSRWMLEHDESIILYCIFQSMRSYGYSGDPDCSLGFELTVMNIAESIAIAARTLPRLH